MVRKAVLYLIVILVVISSANALMASIDKPKMVLYKNVTPDKPLVFEQSVIVNNKNDYDVKIRIEPAGDLQNITKVREKEFVMEGNSRKEAFYEITITRPGAYNGDIIVKFSELDKNVGAALAQTLVVLVKGEGDFGTEAQTDAQKPAEEPEAAAAPQADDQTEPKQKNDQPATGMAVAEGLKEAGPSVLAGILIIIAIILAGVFIYMIFARGAKK